MNLAILAILGIKFVWACVIQTICHYSGFLVVRCWWLTQEHLNGVGFSDVKQIAIDITFSFCCYLLVQRYK
jgi:hypothetical protein